MWRMWLEQRGVKWPNAPAGADAWGVPIDPKYTQTAWCSDMAIQFMRQQREFRPWLMSVNIFQPHHPFFPTKDYLDHYDPGKMPAPAQEASAPKSLLSRISTAARSSASSSGC